MAIGPAANAQGQQKKGNPEPGTLTINEHAAGKYYN
jgi:hypothetical protein